MKKYSILILLFIFSLTACKNNIIGFSVLKNEISSATYVMESENTENDSILPAITLDTEKNSFTFCYDVLSSYLPSGSYEISDNILTAKTKDGLHYYVFNIIDENTLSFSAENSSEIKMIEESTNKIEDGSKFIKAK